MWHVFKSAVVRKLAYLLVALVFAFVAHRAHAGSCFMYTGEDTIFGKACSASTAAQCASEIASELTATQTDGTSFAGYVDTDVPGGQWTGHTIVTYGTSYGGNAGTTGSGPALVGSSYSIACPNTCSATAAPMDLATTQFQVTSSTGLCYAGCEYQQSVQVNSGVSVDSFNVQLSGNAHPTGNQCGTAAQDPPATSGANCITMSGKTECVSDLQNQAIINGDVVNPANYPGPNVCIGYASGAVSCGLTTYPSPGPTPTVPTPPGPDSGTPGVPATPTATVLGNGVAQNYYAAATVAGSTVGVATKGNGSGGPAGGTAPSTAAGVPGDCNQSATDSGLCTAGLPVVTRTDTVASNISAFEIAIGNSPFVQTVNNISTSVGNVGTCPQGTFTLVSFNGHSYDLLASACQIFAMELPNLILISDAAWSLLGIFIVLSA